MKVFLLSIAICGTVAIVAGAAWYKRRQIACERRSAAFLQQFKDLQRGVDAEIKVGASKADVARFYEKRGIHFQVIDSEAIGTILRPGTSECSPFYCGTDEVVIRVRVKFSPQGAVAEEPRVSNMYTDCL